MLSYLKPKSSLILDHLGRQSRKFVSFTFRIPRRAALLSETVKWNWMSLFISKTVSYSSMNTVQGNFVDDFKTSGGKLEFYLLKSGLQSRKLKQIWNKIKNKVCCPLSNKNEIIIVWATATSTNRRHSYLSICYAVNTHTKRHSQQIYIECYQWRWMKPARIEIISGLAGKACWAWGKRSF